MFKDGGGVVKASWKENEDFKSTLNSSLYRKAKIIFRD